MGPWILGRSRITEHFQAAIGGGRGAFPVAAVEAVLGAVELPMGADDGENLLNGFVAGGEPIGNFGEAGDVRRRRWGSDNGSNDVRGKGLRRLGGGFFGGGGWFSWRFLGSGGRFRRRFRRGLGGGAEKEE